VNPVAEGGLTAVTSVLVLLLIAAIFNRVHGQGVNAKGDRIFAGLLALPLITLWVRLVFPNAGLSWALLAAVPLVIYIVLLSLTDATKPGLKLENLMKKDRFTLALLIIVGSFYAILAVRAFQ
jgi:hypothetical protein